MTDSNDSGPAAKIITPTRIYVATLKFSYWNAWRMFSQNLRAAGQNVKALVLAEFAFATHLLALVIRLVSIPVAIASVTLLTLVAALYFPIFLLRSPSKKGIGATPTKENLDV